MARTTRERDVVSRGWLVYGWRYPHAILLYERDGGVITVTVTIGGGRYRVRVGDSKDERRTRNK